MARDKDQSRVYADLGDVWLRDQTARILHRYVLFGRHFRLDLEALLSQIARRLRAPAG
jgi:hypothetical protein